MNPTKGEAMPKTRTTRIGNGAGHGGPAKGAGWGGPANGTGRPCARFTPENQPAPEAKVAGKEFAAEARRRVIERLPEILEAQFARALDISHPQGHAAAKDLLDRICPPESRQTIAGDGSPPRFVIAAPVEMTPKEWSRTYGPGG
jgi:hypothetical protein